MHAIEWQVASLLVDSGAEVCVTACYSKPMMPTSRLIDEHKAFAHVQPREYSTCMLVWPMWTLEGVDFSCVPKADKLVAYWK